MVIPGLAAASASADLYLIKSKLYANNTHRHDGRNHDPR